jgi:malonyl CoA-acyl carrier protein transacylase
VALLFPGQGSQNDGMRRVAERWAPELVEHATELLGSNPFDRLGDGTRFVQPAIYCTSVASARAVAAEVEVVAHAGHSLGELAALAAAGAFGANEGLELVCARADATQEVARQARGSMLAVMGGGIDAVEPIARAAGVAVANDNSPRQLVLSGGVEALSTARDEAVARRLKVRALDVDGAFHSPAMAPAVAPFARALAAVEVREPATRVYSSITAEPFDDVRRRLADALTSRVRWRETVERMHADGVRAFLEVEPGRVLRGLVKRTLEGVTVEAVERNAQQEQAGHADSQEAVTATT